MSLTLLSHAKVNLSLDVLDKRAEDGYHYLRSVMVPISLADRVKLMPADLISVQAVPEVPGPPEHNLAFQAAHLLRTETGYRGGAAIRIEKEIPVAGGLAGGSTNAAAVLRGLNQLWQTGLNEVELIGLAIRLGSDVPFFIREQPARVEGIGELLTPLPMGRPLWMVLATPKVSKSTGRVFGWFDQLEAVERPDLGAMEAALARGDIQAVSAALGNVLEQAMLPRHPEISHLKAAMLRAGACGALMSGAGPTVLGLVKDEQAGLLVADRLRSICHRVCVVQVVHPGGVGFEPGSDDAAAGGSV